MQLREVSKFESQNFLLTVKGERKRTFKNDVQVSGLDNGVSFFYHLAREKNTKRGAVLGKR